MLKYLTKPVYGSVLVYLLSLSASLAATPLAEADFAYTATLSEAKSSLRMLTLPTAVYQKMYRKDLGDLRVFNASGQTVPHQFSRTEVSDSSQQGALVFYPFNKEQAANTGNIEVIIDQKKDQQTLRIEKNNKQNSVTKGLVYQYIIENPSAKLKDTRLCGLKLNWHQEKPSMVLALQVQGSENLQTWNNVIQNASVSKLNYNGSELIRDEIKFDCSHSQYLRLTWLKPEEGVRLNSITGMFKQKGAQALEWHHLGQPRYDNEGHWLFESNVVAEFSQIEFVVPQDGLLFKGALYSRNNSNDDWRRRGSISQYKLTLGDSEFKSSPINISSSNDRFWKLELSNEAQFTDDQLPEIKVAWRPKKLLFMAQGTAPFTLVFGNPAVTKAQNSDLQGLIKSLTESGITPDKVSLGPIKQGTISFNQSDQINWKKYLLWLVLILGTLLMAVMAWRLYIQMNQQSKP